jgi:cytochrome c556
MTRSSRRDPKIKAIAEVLAMIADAHPELTPNRPRAARMADDWLWEDAAEFCAALDRYAERAAQMNRQNH